MLRPMLETGIRKLRTPPQQHVINRADFVKNFLERSHGAEDGLNSVDVWRKMHGDERRYTYYSKGREWGTSCDRVDYAIVGRGLGGKGLVKACEILGSEEERGPSDHVQIWVDISLGKRVPLKEDKVYSTGPA